MDWYLWYLKLFHNNCGRIKYFFYIKRHAPLNNKILKLAVLTHVIQVVNKVRKDFLNLTFPLLLKKKAVHKGTILSHFAKEMGNYEVQRSVTIIANHKYVSKVTILKTLGLPKCKSCRVSEIYNLQW